MSGLRVLAPPIGISAQLTTHFLKQQTCRPFCAVIQTQKSVDRNHKRRITLSIDKLNEQGDGVGSYVSDKGVKMHLKVPFTAPGDTVEAEIWERDIQSREKWTADKHDTWHLFGQQTKVLKPSEHRVRPLCSKYFEVCGGCKLQHVSYAQQLEEKQEWVRTLFASREHSPQMEIRDILGVKTVENRYKDVFHYRNKMEFTCSTSRWLLNEDKSANASTTSTYPFTVGMFPVASVSARRLKEIHGKSKARRRHGAVWSPKILSLQECVLQPSLCNRLLQQLVARCEHAGLQAYDFHTHEGFLKQIVLRRGVNREGCTEIMIGLVTTTFDGEQNSILKSVIHDLIEEHNGDNASITGDTSHLVSIIQRLDSEAQRHHRAASDSIEILVTERVLYGSDHLEDTILGHPFKISFDSFFQPNSVQAGVLYREIQHMMMSLSEKPVVWDLFCGVGSIGICMGAYAKAVVGFELVEAAVERAKINAQLNGYSTDQMQFFCVDLTKQWQEEDLQAKLRSSSDAVSWDLPDMVIVDPPRAGLHKKLIKMLRRLAPRYICYVSCNPHSQVPDLEALCAKKKSQFGEVGSYRVRQLQPVDMLPHTPHIETIAWLERCD